MPKLLPPAYATSRRWTTVEARAVLSAFASSGLSPTAFAAREGLDTQRLRAWQRKLGGAITTPASFVEVRPRASERVESVLRCGLVLRVVESIDEAALRRLVEALDEPPC
ncbi:MAG: hypothetical protein NVS3B10_11760 [Polyangiales bacterium]